MSALNARRNQPFKVSRSVQRRPGQGHPLEHLLGGRNSNLGGPLAPNAPVLHIRSFSIIGGVNVRSSRKKRNRDAGD